MAVHGVEGQWYLDLKIGGQQVIANPSNMTQFYIIQTIHQSLPSMKLAVKDPTGEMAELYRYGEGTKVNCDVGIYGDHIYRDLNFVMLQPPSGNPSDSSVGMHISAVLDNMGYMRKVADKHVKGTGAEAITKWLEEVGLKADVDPTNDKMTWLPNRTSIFEYCKHVAARSFVGPNSALVSGVTDTGVAKFKDINKIIKGGTKKTFSQILDGYEDAIPVLQWNAAPKTAVGNAARGYGATTMSMNEKGETIELNKIDVMMLAERLQISKSAQDIIGDLGSRVIQLPRLSGNTHEKWNEAQHQNKRIKSTFSFDVHIMTDRASQVELLDAVHFVPMNLATRRPLEALQGDYIVSAITKLISGKHYYEKITLTNQGPAGAK